MSRMRFGWEFQFPEEKELLLWRWEDWVHLATKTLLLCLVWFVCASLLQVCGVCWEEVCAAWTRSKRSRVGDRRCRRTRGRWEKPFWVGGAGDDIQWYAWGKGMMGLVIQSLWFPWPCISHTLLCKPSPLFPLKSISPWESIISFNVSPCSPIISFVILRIQEPLLTFQSYFFKLDLFRPCVLPLLVCHFCPCLSCSSLGSSANQVTNATNHPKIFATITTGKLTIRSRRWNKPVRFW